MILYFLFKQKVNDHSCIYIYAQENNSIFSYSFDEDFIVKNEERGIKSFIQLEEHYNKKKNNDKGDKPLFILKKKEFPDVRSGLYYLEGTLEDFEESRPARKKLPQVVNPYDLDFDESVDDYSDVKDSGYGYSKDYDDEDDVYDDAEDEEESGEYDDNDDDYYK